MFSVMHSMPLLANGPRDPQAALAHVATAIAAFESSNEFQPSASKFDDVLRGTAQFTAQENPSFDLFKSKEKANCLGCHVGNIDSKKPEDWLFTDFIFDNLGVPCNANIPANRNPNNFDQGLCKQDGIEKDAVKFYVTRDANPEL